MKFKVKKNKIIGGIALVLILLTTFWYGGNAPGLQGWAANPPPQEKISSVYLEEKDLEEPQQAEKPEPAEQAEQVKEVEEPKELEKVELEKPVEKPVAPEKKAPIVEVQEPEKAEKIQKPEMIINKETGKDQYQTEAVPEGKPVPMEPQNAKITDVAHTATLSVRCDTILDNMEWLNPEKVELIPQDGVIFAKTQVTFYEGESVFNVLQREMKKAKIHMEFVNTPLYNSAYIEGINNLYEFDCGELSGWMYKVNNWFPNYGSSRYQLKAGDIIEWEYSCNLGDDIGGNNSMRR